MPEEIDFSQRQHCRMYEQEGERRWWLMSDCEDATLSREHAHIFTAADWKAWGEDVGLRVEWLTDYECMRLAGAPMLPGFEALAR